MKKFDVLVIGGGHAGLEAAHIAAQFPLKVGLVTMPGVPIASAPCNPAIGGVGKGQVVREIDSLGGLMGILADKAGIQYRTLNQSKGFAVQSTRVQIDKVAYSRIAEETIRDYSQISIICQKVSSIQRWEDGFQIFTEDEIIFGKKVVITTGTFLNGKLHTGNEVSSGGRVGKSASVGLKGLFNDVKTLSCRFKTGTPPRIERNSLDFSLMEEQNSDPTAQNFHCLYQSFQRNMPQTSCYITYTNAETLNIIRDNEHLSPLFNGQITGIGPRYCPSIEDKAHRYPDRQIHHVFVEPESLELDTFYPNGVSTSLPLEVQKSFLRTIRGLENVEISIPGYAVEYDVVDTTQLTACLEYRDISGLYFAGQVNGTSGYEEAAGQGIIAGINASLSCMGKDPFVLSRFDSYIGVMIEDLVCNKRDEPYRLFTARSENRLYIREDNVTLRMAPYRKKLGLNNEIDIYQREFLQEYLWLTELCDETSYLPTELMKIHFKHQGHGDMPDNGQTLSELIKQAHLDPVQTLVKECESFGIQFDLKVIRTVAISKRYGGYIDRSEQLNKKIKKLDNLVISWKNIILSKNISHECRQRIESFAPETFGQLRLIEGIRPATLAIVAGQLS